jgi:hypothetical protein
MAIRHLNTIRYCRAASLLCALALAQAFSVPLSLAADDKGGQDDHNRVPGQTTSMSLPLSGTGVEAIVTFSKPSPALTSRPANTKVKAGTITASVKGNGPLKLTAAPTITRILGDPKSKFMLTGGSCSPGKEIVPGETCTIAVKYEPANEGTSTAHVTLTGTGARETQLHSESFESN